MIAVVAMARNRVIGADGSIPWHLSEDLKFFKRLTLGHVVVMGRKTYESIGRPLPGRENWVLTSGKLDGNPAQDSPHIFRHPEEIPDVVPDGRKIFVIGGAGVYAALLPRCKELYLTRVDLEVVGDTLFPPYELETAPAEIVHRGEGFVIYHHTLPG